jgi:hypothetical protein
MKIYFFCLTMIFSTLHILPMQPPQNIIQWEAIPLECLIPALYEANGFNWINIMQDCYRLSRINKRLSETVVPTWLKSLCMRNAWSCALSGILFLRETSTQQTKARLLNLAHILAEENRDTLNCPVKVNLHMPTLILNEAVMKGDKEMALLLLRHGANPEKSILRRRYDGESYFMNAFNAQSSGINEQNSTHYLCSEGWFTTMWQDFQKESKKVN